MATNPCFLHSSHRSFSPPPLLTSVLSVSHEGCPGWGVDRGGQRTKQLLTLPAGGREGTVPTQAGAEGRHEGWL